MFIRKSQKTDNQSGKKYYSYQLMESVRTERGPRQRLVLNLGSKLSLDDSERKMLANRIEELQAGTVNFISCPDHIESLALSYHEILCKKEFNSQEPDSTREEDSQDFQNVDLNSLTHEHPRSIGVEHAVLETIRKLGLDELLKSFNISDRKIQVIIGVITGKLCKPSSELATMEWLKRSSGIDELLETDFSRLSKDLVYEAADLLLQNRDKIETHLATKESELFSCDETVVFYDLTNTYFEGTTKKVSLAARGKSKENRGDCPLVTLGLVLNKLGFPKKSHFFPGNISEPKTLEDALQTIGNKKNKPIVVLDAGIATRDNLEYLRKEGYKYIVASRRRSCQIPEDLELLEIKNDKKNTVQAGKKINEETGETELYCRSESRAKKEQSMLQLKKDRMEKDLNLAKKALSKKGGIKDYKKVLQRIGRIKERHRSISRYYKIEILPDKDKQMAVSINWEVDSVKMENSYDGAYLLRAYGLDWESNELWNTYIMLTKVEKSFRCLKNDLGLRPVYHQISRRVEGHLFLTVIAYHIMHSILYQLHLKGIRIEWETFCARMETQVRVTTTLKNSDGEQIRVRSSSVADSEQREIYNALGVSASPGKFIKTVA